MISHIQTQHEETEERDFKKEIITTLLIFLFGCLLGLFAKYLDHRQAELPKLLQTIDHLFDLHNYLSAFDPYIFIGFLIAVYSHSRLRAAINVFVFFVGMVGCYYGYSQYVAGFLPKTYALIWVAFTIISPLLALFCYQAKKEGQAGLILSALIIAVFMNLSFSYGIFYISIRSYLTMIMLIMVILILKRSPKETLIMILIALIGALILPVILPYQI